VQCSINSDAEGESNMSSTTLQSNSYALARPQAVGEALHELSVASTKLLKALWAALRVRSAANDQPLAPSDEARRVRELAFGYLNSDPGFAADLFAAADRHERLHGL
jgi:hypothetical protein